MSQAVEVMHTPEELRRLLIICYQEGANPLALCEQFQNAMMEDILDGTEAERTEQLLVRLHHISERHGGKLLRDFPGFPIPAALMHTSEAQCLDERVACLQASEEQRSSFLAKFGELGFSSAHSQMRFFSICEAVETLR